MTPEETLAFQFNVTSDVAGLDWGPEGAVGVPGFPLALAEDVFDAPGPADDVAAQLDED